MKYKLKDKIVFEFRNDWKQIKGKFNWYEFTFVHLYFEIDKKTHGYEFHFMLLGLGFYFRLNTDKSMRQFDKWEKEIKKEILPKDNDKKLKELEKLWKK